MSKNIIVLLKIYKGDLNPFDECALECALSYPDSHITVLAMSPLSHLETLENLTRLGCDAILISDNIYAGSDTIATSKVLAKAIDLLKPDLIFAGRKSVDGNTAQVPLMVSELINYQLINKVISFGGNIVKTRNNECFEISNHQLLIFEKFKPLRAPSIFSKKKGIKVLTNSDLHLSEKDVGLNGSPTRVIRSYPNQNDRRFCQFIDYKKLDSVINDSLKKDFLEEKETINKVPLIHYVGNLKDIAEKYGEKVKEINVNNLSLEDIIKHIQEAKPQIILWEENDKYKEIASRIAIRLNYGLCADCVSLSYINNQFVITRPALGGDVIADIICTSLTSMATIKASSHNNDNIAITIGKGAEPYIDKIKVFADKYQAQIYCSRPLADSSIIDYSRQVGLTGITIAPKVCITIGTSGAIQHIVGINKSQTIIAININKKEKVFDYADYGVVMDIKDIY